MGTFLDILFSAVIIGVGAAIVRKVEAPFTMYPHSPTMDFDWLPDIVATESDPFVLPQGWKRGDRYACVGIHESKKGKQTYLCRQV